MSDFIRFDATPPQKSPPPADAVDLAWDSGDEVMTVELPSGAKITVGTGASLAEATSTPVNSTLHITGTLTNDGSTPFTFPVLYHDAVVNGKVRYLDPTGQYFAIWSGGTWQLGSNDTPEAYWNSSEDVATPDLVETWTPVNPATGHPVVAKTASTGGRQGLMKADSSYIYVACSVTSGLTLWKKVILLNMWE